MTTTYAIHHLSPRVQVITAIRALRLLNPLHTYQQVIGEWRYITLFMSNVFSFLQRQHASKTPLSLDFISIHTRTERQLRIHITREQLLLMSEAEQINTKKEIERRRIRAYLQLLRITSTTEFHQ